MLISDPNMSKHPRLQSTVRGAETLVCSGTTKTTNLWYKTLMFTCIYCKRSEPQVTKSESHVIPDSFGVGPILLDAVCKDCNHRINLKVEQPVKDRLASLRNLIAIDGRRGKPSFLAKVQYLDVIQEVRLRIPAELGRRLFFFELGTDPDGKKKFAIIGDPEKFSEVQARHQERHPGTTWTEIQPAEAGALQIAVEIDCDVFASEQTHRLAAKVAVESIVKSAPPRWFGATSLIQYETLFWMRKKLRKLVESW